MVKKIVALFFLLCPVLHAQSTIPGSGGAAVQVTGPLTANTSPQFSSAYQNVPYSSALNIQGGKAPYTCNLIGSLPTGLSLSNCVISGTPSGSGASIVSFTITDSSTPAQSASITQVSITVATLVTPFLTIGPTGQSILTSSTLQMIVTPTWSSGVPPAQSAAANIGSLVSWSGSGTGFGSISSSGLLTASGSAGSASIGATFNGQSATNVTVTVGTSVPTITNSSPLCNGAVNQLYPDNATSNPSGCMSGSGVVFNATGGTPPYTWAIVSGCPPGLAFTGNVLSGTTTTAAGSPYSCQIKVTDSVSNNTTKTFTTTIDTVSSVTVSPSSPSVNVGATIQMAATANFTNGATSVVTTGNSISLLGSIGCGNASSTSTTSINCPAINLPAGALLVGQMSCSTSTGNLTASDTAANTIVFANNGTLGPASGSYFKSNMFHVLNTVANTADVFTLTSSVSCGFWAGNLAWYSIASPTNDQHPAGEANASSSSLSNQTNSGAITTTSANEVIVQGAVNGTTNRTWTAVPPLTLRVAQSGGQSALGDQIVSSIQTAQTYSMQFSGASDNHISQTLTFAAGSGAGATWSITAGNCIVNGVGLVTANSGTSCTVQASYGGQNGTQAITINSPVLQSIAITPNPASGAVGSTVQLTATGTFVGGSTQNITTTVGWTSNNASIPVSSAGLVSCNAGGTATITAASGSISATDAVTCTAVSSGALLTGCTVSTTNTVVNCTGAFPPAGWTLNSDGAQSFDQALTANYVLDSGASVGSGIGHSGDSAAQCSITGNSNQCGVYYHPNASATSYDVSMWVFEQGGSPGTAAACGDDNFMFVFQDRGKSPNPQLTRFQGWPQTPAYLSPHCDPYWFSEGSAGAVSIPPTGGTGTFNLGLGVWTQYEMQVTGNTCVGATPNNDGSVSIWQNGVLVFQLTNRNLTFCPSMRADTNVSIEAGGTYSATWFSTNGGTNCVARNGGGTPFAANPFSAAPALETDGVTACWGSQKTFNRRFDDLIFLWK